MRPTYENKQSLDAERKTVETLSKMWKVQFIKMPISYHLDYAMIHKINVYQYGEALKDSIVGFAEVKVRTNPITQYDTYMIALSKVLKARQLSEATKKPSILIVNWRTINKDPTKNDCIGWTNFKREFKLGFGGRKDRNDWQDQEPVALYPISMFKAEVNE